MSHYIRDLVALGGSKIDIDIDVFSAESKRLRSLPVVPEGDRLTAQDVYNEAVRCKEITEIDLKLKLPNAKGETLYRLAAAQKFAANLRVSRYGVLHTKVKGGFLTPCLWTSVPEDKLAKSDLERGYCLIRPGMLYFLCVNFCAGRVLDNAFQGMLLDEVIYWLIQFVLHNTQRGYLQAE